MKLPGLVVAMLVLPLVPAAHAQEQNEPVKLADIVGSWAGTWPNVDDHTVNSRTPTRGYPDTFTIRSDSTWRTRGRCEEGSICAQKPRVIGDTLSLRLWPAEDGHKEKRFGYVVALKDQQITITNITDTTSYFIGKRIDVSTPKP